jgi:hypothetical protein
MSFAVTWDGNEGHRLKQDRPKKTTTICYHYFVDIKRIISEGQNGSVASRNQDCQSSSELKKLDKR